MTKEQQFRKQTEEAKFEAFSVMCKKVVELEAELAKREEQIEALNKDKDYFSDALDKQIEATYKVVEENNELKDKYDKCLRENTGLKIHNAYIEKKLSEAKELLNEFLDFEASCMERGIYISDKTRAEVERFLSEVKKKNDKENKL